MTIIGISQSFAQDSSYQPPAMFEDLTPPMVRPEGKDGNLVREMKSSATPLPEEIPAVKAKPVVPPKKSVDPNSPSAPVSNYKPYIPAPPTESENMLPPVAPPKMMQPIVEAPKIAKPKAPEVKKSAAPKISETEIVAPLPPVAPPIVISRDPKESAIKGPKTMPAIPAGEVSRAETFDAPKLEAAPEPTILERHQIEAEEKASETLAPVAPLPNAAVPASFESATDQGILKKSIAFTPGQIGLVPADLEPITAGIIKELGGAEKEDWRVQIRAFATPYGTGLSSDRRIALNRALSLRTALIERGLQANRIDVLADGLQTADDKPGDRIDIYLFGLAQD